MKTIRNIFISFISLIIVYGTIVQIIGNRIGDTSQNMWNRNKILAQEYIYSNNSEPYVIIGSSLSDRLIKDSLGPELYNLSLPGQSVLDCINLIKVAKHPPETIYIETNFINTTLNENFVNSLTTTPRYQLKEHFLFLRQKNQPVGVALAMINFLEEKIKGEPETEGANNDANAQSNGIKPSEEVFRSMLDQKKDEFTNFSPEVIDNTITELKEQVDLLRDRGIKVVFYEIPVEDELMELPRPQAVRKKIQAAFPVSQYKYIDMPQNLELSTTDGIHLDKPSANRYTLFFRNRIEGTF